MIRKARVAVAGYFAILGFVCSAWVSSIDDLKVLLGLDASALGLLLMAGPCGNLVSFTFASALFARIGSRRGLILAVTLYLLAGLGIAASFLLRAPLPVCAARLRRSAGAATSSTSPSTRRVDSSRSASDAAS